MVGGNVEQLKVPLTAPEEAFGFQAVIGWELMRNDVNNAAKLSILK